MLLVRTEIIIYLVIQFSRTHFAENFCVRLFSNEYVMKGERSTCRSLTKTLLRMVNFHVNVMSQLSALPEKSWFTNNFLCHCITTNKSYTLNEQNRLIFLFLVNVPVKWEWILGIHSLRRIIGLLQDARALIPVTWIFIVKIKPYWKLKRK